LECLSGPDQIVYSSCATDEFGDGVLALWQVLPAQFCTPICALALN